MTTKKKEEAKPDEETTPDAPNMGVQENLTVPADRSESAHYLGADALPGEPGSHGVPLQGEDVEARDTSRDTDEYYLNPWNGYDSLQCKRCQFNTLDLGLFREHWASTHAARPVPPAEVAVPTFDRFGNYVPPAPVEPEK